MNQRCADFSQTTAISNGQNLSSSPYVKIDAVVMLSRIKYIMLRSPFSTRHTYSRLPRVDTTA